MPEQKFEYIVVGQYDFPVDMLRYDRSYPADPEAVGAISESIGLRMKAGRREIRLVGLNLPTAARWESFGWRILNGSTRRIR